MSEPHDSQGRRLSPQEVKQLQGAFVVGIVLAAAMLVQLIGRDGPMDAADWLRVLIGVTGLGVSVASAVVQVRRR